MRTKTDAREICNTEAQSKEVQDQMLAVPELVHVIADRSAADALLKQSYRGLFLGGCESASSLTTPLCPQAPRFLHRVGGGPEKQGYDDGIDKAINDHRPGRGSPLHYSSMNSN